MKKKLLSILLCSSMMLVPTTSVFADEKDDKIFELETQIQGMQAIIDELQKELAKYTEGSNQEEYKIGDTWTVPNQWTLTIKSVEEMDERNEFAETSPEAVYLITYEYENLGYEAEGMNGLFIDLIDGIMDSTGKMGYSYPNDVTMYPQETPIGGKCEAQSCVGVDNAGDFKINFSTYDGNSQEQKAVFSLEVK
ncbi:MAG: hypothetical protein Q4F03_04750 [Eubacteriales bacterium]|nr:hypothetical protein [Eubacteriales bacterium]